MLNSHVRVHALQQAIQPHRLGQIFRAAFACAAGDVVGGGIGAQRHHGDVARCRIGTPAPRTATHSEWCPDLRRLAILIHSLRGWLAHETAAVDARLHGLLNGPAAERSWFQLQLLRRSRRLSDLRGITPLFAGRTLLDRVKHLRR